MRYTHILAISLLFLIPALGIGQQTGIDAALKKGDAKALGIFFNVSVDISIPGTDQTLSADKAVNLLSAFFDKVIVKGYSKVHTSAPQQGRADFTVGELQTGQGTYRTTLFFNKEQKISEVEIRKQ